MRASCEQPVHEPARRPIVVLAVVKPVAIEPEAAALARPRPGNNRASACLPASRHHSMAMRSGPSACATAWSARRQRNCARRAVRHFGHHLDRLGPRKQPHRPARRLAFAARSLAQAIGRDARMLRRGSRAHAASGICVSCAQITHDHALRAEARGQPVDQDRDLGFFVLPVVESCPASRNTSARWRADSRIRSKPKPGSSGSASASSRSRNSRAIINGIAQRACRSRRAMRRTAPSVRKNAASSMRAPLPRLSSTSASVRAERGRAFADDRLGRDRLGEAMLGDDNRAAAGAARSACRAGPAPDRARTVKAAPNRAASSPRWRLADIADGLQPGALQCRARIDHRAPSAATGSGATACASAPGRTIAPSA